MDVDTCGVSRYTLECMISPAELHDAVGDDAADVIARAVAMSQRATVATVEEGDEDDSEGDTDEMSGSGSDGSYDSADGDDRGYTTRPHHDHGHGVHHDSHGAGGHVHSGAVAHGTVLLAGDGHDPVVV